MRKFKTLIVWSISILVDALFLLLWAYLQTLVNSYVSKLEFIGLDATSFLVFQIIFFISTLAIVVTYIYVDLRVMLYEAKVEIEKAKIEAGK